MPRPAPTTAPFTAAIVTFGISASSRESSCPARCRSTRCSKVRPSLAPEPMAETSPPAQNARPAPVTTTAHLRVPGAVPQVLDAGGDHRLGERIQLLGAIE